jgi:hypothetical protein
VKLIQVGFITDPKYWDERAAEMRALAEQVKNADGELIMLMLAKNFDWLADWAIIQKGRNGNPTAIKNST